MMTIPKRSRRLRHVFLAAQLIRAAHALSPRFSNGTCTSTHNDLPISAPSTPQYCLPLVDEEISRRTGDWAPWSHRPKCNTPLYAGYPQYCLFTSDTFRGGSGLSILTTPSTAAAVAASLDDAVVSPALRSRSPALGPFQEWDPPFQVVDLPGRGKGMVATRRIAALETVMVDYPTLLILNDIEGADFGEIMAMLDLAADQLPEEGRAVYSLARDKDLGSAVRGVIGTNSYGMELDGVKHMVVFPISSRMNHDCRPNAIYRLLPGSLAQEITAIRDIEVGEELTHNYAGHGMPYAERQERLATSFHFSCTCSLCNAPFEQRQASNKRRLRMRDVLQEVTAPEYRGSPAATNKLLEETLDMLQIEDMWFTVGSFYAGFAWAYLRSGRLKRARKYADLAEEAGRLWKQEEVVQEALGGIWGELKGTNGK